MLVGRTRGGWQNAFVAGDFADRDAGLVDHPADPDARRPRNASDLRDRLTALSDWHPSSPRYRPDHPSMDAEAGSSGLTARDSADGISGGWDVVAAEDHDRPSPADVRVSAERRAHILDGDRTGGGHRHGVGSPGKTEFPADWDDVKIIENVLSVSRSPDQRPARQNWNDRWRVQGKREGVDIVAIVAADGLVWTAWPREGSPGVVKNKPEDG
jgi:hypothetical protein